MLRSSRRGHRRTAAEPQPVATGALLRPNTPVGMKPLVIAGLLACSGYGQAAGQELEVTLLGTGDPTPLIERAGPATLVSFDGRHVLFDVGRGAMQRLYQLGVSTSDLDAIFLTHLHSDHVVGLVDLWLTGWVVNRRSRPLRVYGPIGTRALVLHLAKAFSFDLEIRSSEADRDLAGVAFEVVEISAGYEWHQGAAKVITFDVDHSPIEPAFGFRLDYRGRSVVLSGDTRYSESLIDHARGADLLIHEVAEAAEAFKIANPSLPRLVHHTQAVDAGRVFAAVKPKLAVYSHLVMVRGFDPDSLIPLTRETYDGPLVVGHDLMRFVVGDSIEVHSQPHADRRLTAPVPTPTPTRIADEVRAEVARAAEDFVDAFNNLDWARFEDAWAEDATAFMPLAEFPARLVGRDTIVSTFRSVFADFPDRFEGPPYLSIDPVGLRVDVVESAAIVTFHLGDESPRSRRTLVFVRRGEEWKIAHLHASTPPT